MPPLVHPAPAVAAAYVDRFLAGAFQFRNFVEQGGPNAGQVVETFLKAVGLTRGDPWCMAAMSYIGYHAFLVINPATLAVRSRWGLPMTGGCAYFGDAARKLGVLEREPKRGDIFLKYYPAKSRFAHTGVLVEPLSDGRWITLEGNTNQNPEERDGWGMFLKRQRFGEADRFVRWTATLK